LRTEKVVENSDIVILVLDGTEGITRQDMHIFELVDEYATGLLVVLNKRDLLHAGDIERLTKIFKEKAPFIAWAPILAVSAETKQGIHRIPELIGKISDNRRRSFSNTELESILGKILKLRYIPTPPNIKKITLSDLVQIRPKTPKFAVYSNLPEKIHFSYKRFFRNELYKALKLYGTAIDIRFRKLSKDDL
jgi:GTP-binding protein